MIQDYCDVLILSASYGGGHNQAARAFSQALQTIAPGIKTITVDYCDLLFPLLSRFTQFSYAQSIRHFPVGYALYYQATGNISPDSFWQRRLNRMGYSELIILVNRLKPRVIISTFPLPAGVLSEMKESGELDIPVVTIITDISVHSQWVHPHTDLYIVGSPEVATGLEERGIPTGNIAITGIPVLPEFNKNHNLVQLRNKFGFEPDAKIVLFMGGNDGLFGTTRFNHILKELPDNVYAVVLTGQNQELYERLKTTQNKYPNLKVYSFVEDIAGLMEMAQVLVTKAGGITVSEALSKGLPMVIYKPNPGQEEANARYLRQHRAAFIAKGERRLQQAVQRMILDDQFRERFRRNCLKLGRPDSAEASAKMVLKLMQPHFQLSNYYNDFLRREIRA